MQKIIVGDLLDRIWDQISGGLEEPLRLQVPLDPSLLRIHLCQQILHDHIMRGRYSQNSSQVAVKAEEDVRHPA